MQAKQLELIASLMRGADFVVSELYVTNDGFDFHLATDRGVDKLRICADKRNGRVFAEYTSSGICGKDGTLDIRVHEMNDVEAVSLLITFFGDSGSIKLGISAKYLITTCRSVFAAIVEAKATSPATAQIPTAATLAARMASAVDDPRFAGATYATKIDGVLYEKDQPTL